MDELRSRHDESQTFRSERDMDDVGMQYRNRGAARPLPNHKSNGTGRFETDEEDQR